MGVAVATLRRQCWLFAIGSSFFAVATIPGAAAFGDAGVSNMLCFIGSWFFTSAGWMQLVLADRAQLAGWWSAATQFVGTVAFNISTGAGVWAHATGMRRDFVWTPDAFGSILFLVSGVLGVVAVSAGVRHAMRSRDGQAAWINLIGCVAFGISAVGAFVSKAGATADAVAANVGTFVGAICFLVAALMVLPRKSFR